MTMTAPELMVERFNRASEALAAAERRDPFDDDLDLLVDEKAAARIALRQLEMDHRWTTAGRDLDLLAGDLVRFAGTNSGPGESDEPREPLPWWLVVRLATAIVMEKYELDRIRAGYLLASVSDRRGVTAELLAARILDDSGLRQVDHDHAADNERET
jgi:hypothetical protein